jgi:hypothetical protein
LQAAVGAKSVEEQHKSHPKAGGAHLPEEDGVGEEQDY